MKLRNKKTGEIGELKPFVIDEKIAVWVGNESCPEYRYNSLAELNEDWEDYKEPKEYWWIDTGSIPMVRKSNNPILSTAGDIDKEIGNCFETKEEAEKAVEKLRALKRLKDEGFDILKYAVVDGFFCLDVYLSGKRYEELKDDLKIVFGGEE